MVYDKNKNHLKTKNNICSVANCLKYKYCKSNASTRYKA